MTEPRCDNPDCERECARKTTDSGWVDKWRGGEDCPGWIPIEQEEDE